MDAADEFEDQHQLLAECLRFARGQLDDGAQLTGLLARFGEELLEPRGFDVHDLLEHFVEAHIRRIDDGGRIGLRRRGPGRFLDDIRRRDRRGQVCLVEATQSHRGRVGRGRIRGQRVGQRGGFLALLRVRRGGIQFDLSESRQGRHGRIAEMRQ